HLIVGQAIRVARVSLEALASSRRGIQPVQAASMGADPYDPRIVGVYRPDSILTEARWIPRVVHEARERSSPVIEKVETRVRTDPQPAASVHMQHVDAVVAERGRIVAILAKMCELAGRDIQPIEARVARADPERTVGSKKKRADVLARNISASDEPVERAIPFHETITVG